MSLRRPRHSDPDLATPAAKPTTTQMPALPAPPNPSITMESALVYIIHHAHLLVPEQVEALTELLHENYPDIASAAAYGPDFDLTSEVNTQLALVYAMRDQMINPTTHRLNDGFTTREAKELITASNTLMTTLTRSHEKIINAERQRAIEEAVISYASSLEEEEKEKFLRGLEEELENLG